VNIMTHLERLVLTFGGAESSPWHARCQEE
jgi:hypothetical protein